jgi:hypothetical protein
MRVCSPSEPSSPPPPVPLARTDLSRFDIKDISISAPAGCRIRGPAG